MGAGCSHETVGEAAEDVATRPVSFARRRATASRPSTWRSKARHEIRDDCASQTSSTRRTIIGSGGSAAWRGVTPQCSGPSRQVCYSWCQGLHVAGLAGKWHYVLRQQIRPTPSRLPPPSFLTNYTNFTTPTPGGGEVRIFAQKRTPHLRVIPGGAPDALRARNVTDEK